jgi:hypothetical protein
MGFGYGTISIGGNIFTYDLHNGEIKQITNYTEEIQVTEIEMRNGKLHISGIRYVDNTFTVTEPFVEEIYI